MIPVTALWLPILAATAAVYLASMLAWMVLGHHKADWAGVPGEEALRTELRRQTLGPGQYTFPRPASREEWGTPEFRERVRGGPAGFLILQAPERVLSMGRSLLLWAVYALAVTFTVGYLGSRYLPAGSSFLTVMQITGTVAMLAWAAGPVPKAIWFGFRWGPVWKEVADGVAYALLTGAIFAWLWPG